MVIYNTVMSMCADAGEWRQVLALVKQMTEEDGIKPDRISFDCLMKACGNGGDWEQALVCTCGGGAGCLAGKGWG